MSPAFKRSMIRRVVVNVSALKIHMSENAHEALDAFPEFVTEPRGEISVKVTFSFFLVSAVRRESRIKHSDDEGAWT